MPYLSKADFVTHIYAETINSITRGTDAILDTKISEAVQLAKSYLSRYDLEKLFNPAATGYVADENLKSKIKSITVWNLLKLANPTVDMDTARLNYEDAIQWLKDVQKEIANPDGWPYKTDDTATSFPEGSTFSYSSTKKRTNGY